MKWDYLSYGRELFHDDDGKIHGTASRGSDEYYATLGSEQLGSYISMDAARRAVERAYEAKTKDPK